MLNGKNNMNGLIIQVNNGILEIKGDSADLKELSRIIKEIGDSPTNNHIHLDGLTIIDEKSFIKEVIIEKK